MEDIFALPLPSSPLVTLIDRLARPHVLANPLLPRGGSECQLSLSRKRNTRSSPLSEIHLTIPTNTLFWGYTVALTRYTNRPLLRPRSSAVIDVPAISTENDGAAHLWEAGLQSHWGDVVAFRHQLLRMSVRIPARGRAGDQNA